MRIGLGPVFTYEWLRTARNWRVYGMRFLFGLSLLVVLAFVAYANATESPVSARGSIQQQAEEGIAFSMGIVITQICMILLVAPAATASAICLDKQRGTLAHVLVTDLSNAEVVLGKLAARLLPAIGLVFEALGIMAICTLMGGIDPVGLVGALLVTLGCAVFAGTLSLCISVYAGKTHEVIMATYLVLIAWLLFYPIWYMVAFSLGWWTPPDWPQYTNPFILVADVQPGAVPLHRHALFFAACVGVSMVLAMLATLRIRKVAIHQMNRAAGKPAKKGKLAKDETIRKPGMRRTFRFLSPSLDRNPVLWREWHRNRPSKWMRAIWYVYTGSAIVGMAWGMYEIGGISRRGNGDMAIVLVNGLLVGAGLLLLSVSASTALAEERVRGSLDVLLTTPLSTASILKGKWWGAFRPVLFLAGLPAILVAFAVLVREDTAARIVLVGGVRTAVAIPNVPHTARWFAVPIVIGLTLAYGAVITSFGLAMATWISRLDRAVGITVGMYAFISVVWLFIVAMAFQDDGMLTSGLASGSPFFGVAYFSGLVLSPINQSRSRWDAQIAWSCFWILADFSIAATLSKLTLMTFNRKIGRTPESGMKRPATPKSVAGALAATTKGSRTLAAAT